MGRSPAVPQVSSGDKKTGHVADAVLEIRDLTVEYRGDRRFFRAERRLRVLDHFSLAVGNGETIGVVGESGSGKTTLLQSLLRLIPVSGGSVIFEGQDLLKAKGHRLRQLRRHIQIVFQNPYSSLDPMMTVFDSVAEPLRVHTALKSRDLSERVAELLSDVGVSTAAMRAHPHELSGGQAQRVALARALALRPKVVLLDEPTSSLDVSVQAQVLNLLQELKSTHQLTYVMVSHDLGVVRHISDRVVVMYLGEAVESGPASRVLEHPQHPYTQALLAASGTSGSLIRRVVKGSPPSFSDPPPGCRFHPRCPHVMEVCRVNPPTPINVGANHSARCFLLDASSTEAVEEGRNVE